MKGILSPYGGDEADMKDRAVRTPAMSFIVRVWTDHDDRQMRGEIEHLGTGEKRFFPNHLSLLNLLETWRGEPAERAG
jgi:hypothetical protein